MKENNLPSLLYTVPEAAAILKIPQQNVRELVYKGHIQGLRLGRLKITHMELERFLQEGLNKDYTDLDAVKTLVG